MSEEGEEFNAIVHSLIQIVKVNGLGGIVYLISYSIFLIR